MRTSHLITILSSVAAITFAGTTLGMSQEFVAKTPLKLGYSVYDLSNPAFQDWLAGVKAGAKAGGAELVVADQKSSLANQVSGSADLINQGISGLIVTPVQPAALPQTITLAHKNKIPVVIGDIGVAGDYDAYVVSDSVAAGKLAADYIIGQIKDKPGTHEVGMILLHTGSVVGEDRDKGFRAEIAKDSSFKIVAEANGNDTEEGGFRAAKDELAAHPQIQAIFGTNGGTALGAARALQTTDRKAGPEGVVVIGIDGTQPELDAIAKGALSATIGQDFYGLGKTASGVALDLIKGKAPAWSDASAKTVLYPVQIVDKDNLEKFVQFLKDEKK
jgi:ribose transport system substrate-binding protein